MHLTPDVEQEDDTVADMENDDQTEPLSTAEVKIFIKHIIPQTDIVPSRLIFYRTIKQYMALGPYGIQFGPVKQF